MKFSFILVLCFCSLLGYSQGEPSKPSENFNMEDEGIAWHTAHLPSGWWKWGKKEDYTIHKDTADAFEGKFSILLSRLNVVENGFAAAVYRLPLRQAGKEVELTGYIKTQDVIDGQAYFMVKTGKLNELWSTEVTCEKRKGTSDWQKFSVSFPITEGAEYITIACKLTGGGSAWFDDFDVLVDGESVN